MKRKILIAEDDLDIVSVLKMFIEDDQTSVYAGNDGETAWQCFLDKEVDLVLVDIMMPKIDGYTLIKKIRSVSKVPIIIISSKKIEDAKIHGLGIGADDYIEKPFNPLEVNARINACIRRFKEFGGKESQWHNNSLTYDCLQLQVKGMVLLKKNEEIKLTPTEFRILQLFMTHPGQVFTRESIYETINSIYFGAEDQTLMVHISNLRAKIEDDTKQPRFIKTIWGVGYKFGEN